MIRNLQLSYVKEVGYTNLRCTWVIGCPNEVKPRLDSTPADNEDYSRVRVEAAYAEAHQQLFPNKEVPREVGAHCGAQFAVTREKILEKPRAEYQRIRQWLLETPLEDSVSGRILEYSWHSRSSLLGRSISC